MRISAKADYAVRALVVLAGRERGETRPLKAEEIARAAAIPAKFLEAILLQMRREGLVESKRGADGGYRLARSPEEISVAEAVRAIEGPLALVAGREAGELPYPPAVSGIAGTWRDVAEAYAERLEAVSIASLVATRTTIDFQI